VTVNQIFTKDIGRNVGDLSGVLLASK